MRIIRYLYNTSVFISTSLGLLILCRVLSLEYVVFVWLSASIAFICLLVLIRLEKQNHETH